MRTAALYRLPGARSTRVCQAMHLGVRRCGRWRVLSLPAAAYARPEHDVAVFYGQQEPLRRALREYAAAAGRHAVYVDLGYWQRRVRGRYDGYHKVVVNARHPGDRQLRRSDLPDDRWRQLRLDVVEAGISAGPAVLVAGMSAKAAWTWDLGSEEWERATIASLREVTDRPILYRPKPSWVDARPIEGSVYADPTKPLELFLRQSRLVVTHHSNVGVDAILASVPVHSVEGAAHVLSEPDPLNVEAPRGHGYATRRNFLVNLAYCQWTLAEMASGEVWDHLLATGELG